MSIVILQEHGDARVTGQQGMAGYYGNGMRFASCCGGLFYSNEGQMNKENIGMGFMVNPDESKLAPENEKFDYRHIPIGDDLLVVQRRQVPINAANPAYMMPGRGAGDQYHVLPADNEAVKYVEPEHVQDPNGTKLRVIYGGNKLSDPPTVQAMMEYSGMTRAQAEKHCDECHPFKSFLRQVNDEDYYLFIPVARQMKWWDSYINEFNLKDYVIAEGGPFSSGVYVYAGASPKLYYKLLKFPKGYKFHA